MCSPRVHDPRLQVTINGHNKWRWWIQFTGCLYRQGAAQAEGRWPPSTVTVILTWTEWSLVLALLWWQFYKCHRGYYYYYYYNRI